MNGAVALAAYVAFFEQLTPARLAGLDRVFAPDARFKDPFNDVRGIAAIERVLAHMYATLDQPRFQVLDSASHGCLGYLHWAFLFEQGGRTRRITGMSRVVFDDHGRATEHIDFWDPAEQLYRHVPLLGRVLGWIGRRLAAPQP